MKTFKSNKYSVKRLRQENARICGQASNRSTVRASYNKFAQTKALFVVSKMKTVLNCFLIAGSNNSNFCSLLNLDIHNFNNAVYCFWNK